MKNRLKLLCVFGCFLCYFFADGCTYSFGLLYPELLANFNQTNSHVAFLSGLIYGIPQILAPIVCHLQHTFGCSRIAFVSAFLLLVSYSSGYYATRIELLWLSVGVFTSLGLECGYISGIMFVSTYYNKRRALFTGITTAGGGVGIFCLTYLLAFLTEKFTYRGAMLLVAGLCFNVAVSASLFLSYERSLKVKKSSANRRHSQQNVDGEQVGFCVGFCQSFAGGRAAVRPRLLIFCACHSLISMWVMLPWTLFYTHATGYGQLNAAEASGLQSAMGLLTALGQIAWGFAGDRANPLYLLCLCMLLAGACCALIGWAVGLASLVPICVVYALTNGGLVSLLTVCLIRLSGLSNLHVTLSVASVLGGATSLAGTSIAGLIADRFGYQAALWTAGGAVCVTSVALAAFVASFDRQLLVRNDDNADNAASVGDADMDETKTPMKPRNSDADCDELNELGDASVHDVV
ncbi:hypothetical protein BOX15_Mlig031859g1 [Macrostomum lignano]|uniref:Major facilitator superfamily (MFS) profile domain-containing protein n=2 Tax=Macrostomum lignano TaxID=282301 RepID=A0A267G6I7_9PLAT|nr:hypothetical protein BOX15_Mlig031859g1 [Macrostomum lignano]